MKIEFQTADETFPWANELKELMDKYNLKSFTCPPTGMLLGYNDEDQFCMTRFVVEYKNK